MKSRNIHTECRRIAERHHAEILSWGIRFLVDDELTALQIAYTYRTAPGEVLIEDCPNVGKLSVTVFKKGYQR